jgi:hypothetical protein
LNPLVFEFLLDFRGVSCLVLAHTDRQSIEH